MSTVVCSGRIVCSLDLFPLSIDVEDKVFDSTSQTNIKALGILLDGKLSMHDMVSSCCKSCFYQLKTFQSVKHYLDTDTKLMLVHTNILSRLDYCNILLSGASKTLIKKLQSIINASVRFIFNLGIYDPVSQYCKQCHILPVKYRIMFKSCLTVYKIVNHLAPHYLNDLAKRVIPNRDNLRSSNDTLALALPQKQKCIQHNMINNWNSLSFEIRDSNSVESFKKSLKTNYFQLAYVQ